MPFLPVEMVEEAWTEMMEAVDRKGVREVPECIDGFMRYFGRTYVGKTYGRFPSTKFTENNSSFPPDTGNLVRM